MASVFVAIPAMNESEFLPNTLKALSLQTTNFRFEVFVCVNQPDYYWEDSNLSNICEDNRKTLDFLHNYEKLTLHILDYSSKGCGWNKKKSGVGFARKVLFDSILQNAAADDIIVSLDADTYISPDYLQSVYDNFKTHKKTSAIAVPYYHKIDNCDESHAKSLLRYEIYMRNYLVNLLKINSPYAFTALGSAIAAKVGTIAKIGGITPYQSGEDFYLLQKIVKMGGLRVFNTEYVYPSSRVSTRVPFGTGPAVKRGLTGDRTSYPIYHHSLFEDIESSYKTLEKLYENNTHSDSNRFLNFISSQNNSVDVWESIRKNVSDYEHFEKAFHQKADGLKILQFLRQMQSERQISDDQSLKDNLSFIFGKNNLSTRTFEVDIENCSVQALDDIRNIFFEEELRLRQLV